MLKDANVNGLSLAREYYAHCRPLLQEELGGLLEEACVGLVGEGSECFGLDDDYSRDHDFGACFCLWFDEEVLVREHARIEAAFQKLPESFAGFPSRLTRDKRMGRVGPLSTERFYRFFLGRQTLPERDCEWLVMAEDQLACCTNGEIFEDHQSRFGSMRSRLLAHYPQEVRLVKLAARCLQMAQAGQYNYPRCLAREDRVAAFFALSRFAWAALSFVYLINGRYMPFYKHAARLAKSLPLMGSRISALLAMIGEGMAESDSLVQGIEDFATDCTGYLREQGLSQRPDNWLWDQAGEIMQHVHDPELRRQNLLCLA